MKENVVKTVNWFDIKDDVKIIKDDKVSKRIKSHNVVMHHKNNVNTLDGSINVNHAICKKVTAKNIEPFESILVYKPNDKVKYHCDGGMFNGKTICVKCRSNTYNFGGNFTFTEDDLSADMIAAYYYDPDSNIGHWFICDRSRLRKNKMRKSQSIYICHQDYIKEHAWCEYTVTFER